MQIVGSNKYFSVSLFLIIKEVNNNAYAIRKFSVAKVRYFLLSTKKQWAKNA